MGLRIARLGEKRSQRFLFGLLRRIYSKIIWDRWIAWLFHNLAIRANSQTVLAGNGDTYTDPDLCRTGLAQRMELARRQCGQIKITSWRLAMFPSATEALK